MPSDPTRDDEAKWELREDGALVCTWCFSETEACPRCTFVRCPRCRGCQCQPSDYRIEAILDAAGGEHRG